MPLNISLNFVVLIGDSDCTLVSVIWPHKERFLLRQHKVPKTFTWMGLADGTKGRADVEGPGASWITLDVCVGAA